MSKSVGNFQIDLTHRLGKGNFAEVFKAFDLRDPTIEAAVKMISVRKLHKSQEEYNLFMREIEVLRQIKGDHVAQLLDAKMTANNLYIFMEYCDGGTLTAQLSKKKYFSEEEACSILKQIANAFTNLSLIDRNGLKAIIMHRDIKPDNILFHKGKVKVADFGFAKTIHEMDKNTRRAHTICGTPVYEAPQVLAELDYSAKCDIWSAGVLFYQILFGKLPWETRYSGISRLLDAIRARPLNFPGVVSSEVKKLINSMLMVREEERISWSEVLNHPALNREKEMMQGIPKSIGGYTMQGKFEQKQLGIVNQNYGLARTPKKEETVVQKENITPMKREVTPTRKIFGDEFKKKREFFPEPIRFGEMNEKKDLRRDQIGVEGKIQIANK